LQRDTTDPFEPSGDLLITKPYFGKSDASGLAVRRAADSVIHSGPHALLKTGVCLGQREADNKTGTCRCLNPYVATVVENSSAGER
jgi:hypothetical protein